MTPTNEAGHGLPELPEPLISGGNDNSLPDLGRGCTGYTADQMRQYARDALALSRGVPEGIRGTVESVGICGMATIAVDYTYYGPHILSKGDTFTLLNDKAKAAPAAAGAQGEDWFGDVLASAGEVIPMQPATLSDAALIAGWEAKAASYDKLGPEEEGGDPTGDKAKTLRDCAAELRSRIALQLAPQPAAADGGVRERAQSERHLDGLRISLRLGGVRLLSNPFDNPKSHGEAMRAINDSLSSHRQAGDESLYALHSRFLSDTSGLPEEWQDWRNDFARDIRALVEKGAGS